MEAIEPQPIGALLPAAHGASDRGLRALLEGDARFEILAETTAALVAEAERRQPDLIVLEPSTPRGVDLQPIRDLARSAPASKVCVFTDRADLQALLDARRAGASGYLLRSNPSADFLLDALAVVGRGGIAIDPAINALLSGPEGARLHIEILPAPPGLSDRELAVLRSLGTRLTEEQTAEDLALGLRTVKRIVLRLRTKLDARDLTELLLKAERLGLLDGLMARGGHGVGLCGP